MTYRFALVGCGRIAERHATLLASGEIPGAALAAVCDLVPERAAEFGIRFGVPWFPSVEALLDSGNTNDAFSVLTDSGSHADVTCRLAHTGKPIVVEKPMALTLDDADAMIQHCASSGSRLFVVKQNRWNAPIRRLRGALEDGKFGRIVMGTVRVRWCRRQDYYDQDPWRGKWATDGGVIANQASHHVDVLKWMLGDVESVFALSRTALVDIEVEDTAVVVLRFRSGALGVIEATTATRPVDLEGSLSILGEKGTVEISGFALNSMRTWEFEDESVEDQSDALALNENPPNVYGFGHREFYRHVVDCLESGAPQLVDGLEGRKALELILAIYESIETHQEVFLRFAPRECRLGIQ